MSEAKTTRDHGVIRRWAEERGGRPATVSGTGDRGGAGVLRLDFEPPDETLAPISWDDFFRKFDAEDLAFLYQEGTSGGEVSRFHKFIHR
ncbi:MAG TPA: hypothetical protein VHC42_10710 [Rhizomicrobium sp.]|nr:hypothetical protein [Rhizomicrobium sp.]